MFYGTKKLLMNNQVLAKFGPPLYICLVGLLSLTYSPVLFAMSLNIQAGVNSARGDGQPTELFGTGGVLTSITNTLLFIVGALSVIMIIIGGLRYVVSGGNSTSITGAKNTILYALVGLVVAFVAYAAINFVLGTLTTGSTTGTNI